MLTITMGTVLTRYQQLADILQQLDRHPLTEQRSIISNLYRSGRDFISSLGESFYLTEGAETPIPAPAAGRWYSQVSLPLNVVQVYGVDVRLSQEWYQLERHSWNARARFQGVSRSNKPFAYAIVRSRSGTPAAPTAGALAIMPGTTAGQYLLWTLDEQPDITNDTDSLFFPSQSAYDWLVYKAVIETCAIRDNDSSQRVAAASHELQRAERELRTAAQQLNKAGPLSLRKRNRGSRYG
jgi:hypothetical protein